MSMEQRYKVRAILCDLDGTLVDSGEDLRAALNIVLGQLGLRQVSLTEVRGMIGDGVPKLIERGLVATGGDVEQAPSLVPAFLKIYEADPTARTCCYPSVVEVLETIKQRGGQLGVVTNKPLVATEKILSSLGIRDAFDAVVGGDSFPERKPHPRPLLEAARKLDLDVSDVLMVGDNIHDIEAARAGGMRSIAVTYGYYHQPPASFGADSLIDRFEDLLPLIEISPAPDRPSVSVAGGLTQKA